MTGYTFFTDKTLMLLLIRCKTSVHSNMLSKAAKNGHHKCFHYFVLPIKFFEFSLNFYYIGIFSLVACEKATNMMLGQFNIFQTFHQLFIVCHFA